MVEVAANDHQLVLALTRPLAVIDRKALAGQMEHVAAFTLVEPQDAFGAEHRCRKLVVEEVLEFAQRERSITAEGERGVALDRQVVGRTMAVSAMAVVIVVVVIVAVMVVAMGVMAMVVMAVFPVIMVMAAMPMVVIAIAVVEGRIVSGTGDPVAFKQPHTQQQR